MVIFYAVMCSATFMSAEQTGSVFSSAVDGLSFHPTPDMKDLTEGHGAVALCRNFLSPGAGDTCAVRVFKTHHENWIWFQGRKLCHFSHLRLPWWPFRSVMAFLLCTCYTENQHWWENKVVIIIKYWMELEGAAKFTSMCQICSCQLLHS